MYGIITRKSLGDDSAEIEESNSAITMPSWKDPPIFQLSLASPFDFWVDLVGE
jgi:hypothetical protein